MKLKISNRVGEFHAICIVGHFLTMFLRSEKNDKVSTHQDINTSNGMSRTNDRSSDSTPPPYRKTRPQTTSTKDFKRMAPLVRLAGVLRRRPKVTNHRRNVLHDIFTSVIHPWETSATITRGVALHPLWRR